MNPGCRLMALCCQVPCGYICATSASWVAVSAGVTMNFDKLHGWVTQDADGV